MTKRKLKKFAENITFPNLVQPSFDEIKNGLHLQGLWAPDFFGNPNPVILELGCGKGEYTVGLAEQNNQRNYLGVDIKGARLWAGCKAALEKKLNNAGFIRTEIGFIDNCFSRREISEIWLTFPDPYPKRRSEKKRLTSPWFLARYAKILKPDAVIHLKTDNLFLFNYTLEVIRSGNHKLHFETYNLYNSDFEGEARNIRTFYEQQFLEQGLSICYIQFSLNENMVK